MNSQQLLNKFSLSEAKGWQAINFPLANKDSFYSYMIENHDLSFAWVAITNKVSLEEFKHHYFKRTDPIESGERNFLPRLLIVFNGRRWYAANMSMGQFVACKEDELAVLIVNELKKVSAFYALIKYNPKRLKEINETVKEIVNMSVIISDPFGGSGSFITSQSNQYDLLSDHPDKIKVLQFQKRNKALELACDKISKEFVDQNALLHSLLKTFCTEAQLASLKQFKGLFNYVNPWYLEDKGVIVKIIEGDPFCKKTSFSSKEKCYMLIDKCGTVKPIKFKKEETECKLFINQFFRLNITKIN